MFLVCLGLNLKFGVKSVLNVIAFLPDVQGPSLSQQLTTSTWQLQEILQGLKKSITSVTDLTLTFQHEQKEVNNNKRNARSRNPDPVHFASFSIVSHTICAMLAKSVPMLESLTVEGLCMDAALATFGSFCPALSSLQLHAVSVSLQAVKNLGTVLPYLTAFKLTLPKVRPYGQQLTEYVGSCMLQLRPSRFLTKVELNFKSDSYCPTCLPAKWLQVPETLRDLVYITGEGSIRQSPAMLSRLHSLEICGSSSSDIFAIMNLAPHLMEISTIAEAILQCDADGVLADVSILRDRMDGGFQLSSQVVSLVGTSHNIRAVLEGLPPLSNNRATVIACKLQFTSPPCLDCLTDVARVFPRLTSLHMEKHFVGLPEPEMGGEMLAPLVACTSLLKLTVRTPLIFTTTALIELCLSMRSLILVRYMHSEDVDRLQLKAALDAVQHRVVVMPYH